MSDQDLTRYEQRREAQADQTVDRIRRQNRIRELEAEQQRLTDAMEDSGPMAYAGQAIKSVGKTAFSVVGGGIRDAAVSMNKKGADAIGWGMEKQAKALYAVLGFKPEQGDAMAAELGEKTADTLNVAEGIPEVPMGVDPEESPIGALVETGARSMVQFFALYGPALKMIKTTGSGRLASDIYAGAAADMLAFENKEGTFSDFARELGFENEVTQFLSGELSDNEFDASLKAALEGAGLGASFFMIGKTFKVLRDGYRMHGGGMVQPGSRAAQRGAVGDLNRLERQADELEASGDAEGADALRRQVADEAPQPQVFDERIKANLTPEEQALMTPKDRTTMESLLQTTATAGEVASMAAAGGAKRGWYQESVQALRHVFGDDADRFASLLSATSPQTSVESNLRNALNVWKNWDAAGRPQDAKTIKQIMGDSVEGVKGEESVLNAWINNSARALTSDDPLKGLSGPKVDSFMRNLAGNMQEVTQDTWMARALGMDQARDFSGRNLKGFEDEVGALGQKKPGYLAGNMLVREAADIMKKSTGEDWTPAEVQETVWSWAKAIYEAKGAAGETRSIPEILKAGIIDDDRIRDVPDFATMFGREGEFRDILEGAGYGQQIAELPASGFGSRRAVSSGVGQGRDIESSARRLNRTSLGTEQLKQAYERSVVRPGTGNAEGGIPGLFRTTNRRTGTGYLSGLEVEQFTLPSAQKKAFNALNIATPPVSEFTAPDKFHQAISAAKTQHPHSGAVHVYSLDEYADMRTFTTTDGTAGFAIKPDGDIVSVFNTKSGPHRQVAPHMIALAIEQGGKKLDAFDINGYLPNLYDSMGFSEVGREVWNPKFKPDDWDEKLLGTPDVVMMELQ